MRVLSYILTAFGILFLLFTIVATTDMPQSVYDPKHPAPSIIALCFVLFGAFYLPTFLLLYFGHRIRKKQKLKAMAAAPFNPQSTPVQVSPPVQQRVETRTVNRIVEAPPTSTPKKSVSVSVECRGCGARKAVVAGESSECDYCGSPLIAKV
ncbi:hypothetical protein [Paenibacillus paeoniae]|uniref:Uncharacterized protein n=1 Tax=Paenibacillus paeoniae TaxID=2292705 RepID=A0A371P7M9_9BACL|nr:hypothetical protein [Paenibacillus paeoniae]REK71538.1 hypothetical protein DX130_21295 [Paenibacillus paeoniae]